MITPFTSEVVGRLLFMITFFTRVASNRKFLNLKDFYDVIDVSLRIFYLDLSIANPPILLFFSQNGHMSFEFRFVSKRL